MRFGKIGRQDVFYGLVPATNRDVFHAFPDCLPECWRLSEPASRGLFAALPAISNDQSLTRWDRFVAPGMFRLSGGYNDSCAAAAKRDTTMREFNAIQGILIATLIGMVIWLLIAFGVSG